MKGIEDPGRRLCVSASRFASTCLAVTCGLTFGRVAHKGLGNVGSDTRSLKISEGGAKKPNKQNESSEIGVP